MKVLFISNYLNYHQSCLFDELKKVGLNFIYLSTEDDNSYIKPKVDRDYSLSSQTILDNDIPSFLDAFDIIVYGACLDRRFINHIPKQKILFHNSEHFWKKINTPISILKRVIRSIQIKRRYKKCGNLYLLANSYYLKREFDFLRIDYKKCYKFGYFPPVNTSDQELTNDRNHRITYIGRAIKLKRIEHSYIVHNIIEKRFKNSVLDIYAEGPYLNKLKKRFKNVNVHFHSFLPHDVVLKELLKTDIFVFSSNREEGWGAILNEALSCGCIVFAAKQAGSTMYLIKDGINGFVYESVKELRKKVNTFLNMSQKEIDSIRLNAFKTINELWNASNAASGLNQVFNKIVEGCAVEYEKDGPLSYGE